jgi:hypothetical protein
MNGRGIETLADAALLFAILMVGMSAMLLADRDSPAANTGTGIAYAEDVRLAVFRTRLDGLGFTRDGAFVRLPAGTTVETFLRMQVHLLSRDDAPDFSAANTRVADLAKSLLRPGWNVAIAGGEVRGEALMHIPGPPPPAYFESAWTYPPLPGEPRDVRLAVAVWLSPR